MNTLTKGLLKLLISVTCWFVAYKIVGNSDILAAIFITQIAHNVEKHG